MPDDIADLKRRVTQLEQVVAQLCEQMAAEDEGGALTDLEGNVVMRPQPSADRFGGL